MSAQLSWFALVISLLLGLPAATVQTVEGEATPEVIHRTAPLYPALALSGRASGTVAVTVEIDNQGKVVSARMTRGNPLLSAASVNAARQWKFKPNPNRATKLTRELVFDFLLQECRSEVIVVDPYHLQISSYQAVVATDIEDNVPKELEGTLCKVHHVRLQRDTVEISYGLVGFREGYLKAEQRLFPNANTHGSGGCILETTIDPCSGKEIQTSPKFSAVLYCSACRRAQARWSKSHQHAKFAM